VGVDVCAGALLGFAAVAVGGRSSRRDVAPVEFLSGEQVLAYGQFPQWVHVRRVETP
jgi:hypothetical protein